MCPDGALATAQKPSVGQIPSLFTLGARLRGKIPTPERLQTHTTYGLVVYRMFIVGLSLDYRRTIEGPLDKLGIINGLAMARAATNGATAIESASCIRNEHLALFPVEHRGGARGLPRSERHVDGRHQTRLKQAPFGAAW